MSVDGNPEPPLSLDEFQLRSRRIAEARDRARREYEKHGLEEADNEHEYRKRKAAALAVYRAEGKGVAESETLAEGEVAEWRHRRDTAHVLRRSAELRIAELEGNRAQLRQAAEMSRGIEFP